MASKLALWTLLGQLAKSSVPKVAELVREAAHKISLQMGYSATRRS